IVLTASLQPTVSPRTPRLFNKRQHAGGFVSRQAWEPACQPAQRLECEGEAGAFCESPISKRGQMLSDGANGRLGANFSKAPQRTEEGVLVPHHLAIVPFVFLSLRQEQVTSLHHRGAQD